MKKRRFYVVWNGLTPGVYDSWEECKAQIAGVKQALYKAFDTREEAERAYSSAPGEYIGAKSTSHKPGGELPACVIKNALAVDAACSGNPGMMEYRGVDTATGREIFRMGPYPDGTNNVGEFLALVHGISLMKKNGCALPIYSDSVSAIAWVRDKHCKTKLMRTERNIPLFDLIARAERWLQSNTYSNQILKWDTPNWGEIPADFGRK